ncbi:MAG: hypothetical protein Q9198_010447, partial [Flavoplaca austrocitrina]
NNNTLAINAPAKGPSHDHQSADIANADKAPDGPAVEFVEGYVFGGAQGGDELRDHEDADWEDGEEVDADCPAVPAGAVVEPVAGSDGAGKDGVEAEVGEAKESEC